MKKIILMGMLCFVSSYFSFSQNFSHEAKLPDVKENGFYNILLIPEVTQHLKYDLSDVRIYDHEQKEIPYILKSENSSSSNVFNEYSILENKSTPKCCTQLILHNTNKSNIDNISLIIKNSDVRKKARLSGSDDNINWYIIKDDYSLESIYNDKATSEVKILNFPLSDYSYYKLDIDDSLNAPIKILKAGYYDSQFEDAKYLTLAFPSITQKDSSDKKSYIKFSFGAAQFISKIKIEVNRPEYFLREATVCKLIKDKTKSYFETIARVELRSNHENTIMLDYLKADELYLIVDNKDNQPLAVKSITGYQLIHYLTAQLDKNNHYVLRFGNSTLNYPQYDLEFFKDSIHASKMIVTPEKTVSLAQKETIKKDDFFSTNLWIWVAIILVVALLGYMSFKMIREIK